MILTDFKSSPFPIFNTGNLGNANYSGTATALYNGYTGTGLNGVPDTSLDTLVGSKWSTDTGQTLTLVSNAATALVAGVLVQAPAEVTAFEKMAITVPTTVPATAGTYQVYVTNGGTKMNINQFAGGQLVVAAGVGIGQTFTIASHTAAVATTGKITVTLVDPIQTTLDATSVVSFVYNPAKNVIISPSTGTGLPVGATVYPMPASVANIWDGTSGALTTAGTPQYGFVVSHGLVGILVDNTITNVCYPVGPSQATPGAIGVATLTTKPQIGISAQTLTSAQVGPIYLML